MRVIAKSSLKKFRECSVCADAVFRRLEKIFQAGEGTAQADEREVLVTLVEAYEDKHYDFRPADPVEAIKFRMEQDGLTPRAWSLSSVRVGGCPR